MAKSNLVGAVNVSLIALWTFVGVHALGSLYLARAEAVADDVPPAGTAVIEMPYCMTEDGSDWPGRYCLWVDPQTGQGYINPTAAEVMNGSYEPDTSEFIGGFN